MYLVLEGLFDQWECARCRPGCGCRGELVVCWLLPGPVFLLSISTVGRNNPLMPSGLPVELLLVQCCGVLWVVENQRTSLGEEVRVVSIVGMAGLGVDEWVAGARYEF